MPRPRIAKVCQHSQLPAEIRHIPLGFGRCAIIDAQDFDYLGRWYWYAHENFGIWYAHRQERIEKGRRGVITVLMHRVIMAASPGTLVDHKDGNGLNNTRENLRFATHRQNVANRKLQRNNTSGFKGVQLIKGKWISRIAINHKIYQFGPFPNKIEAAKAYEAAAKKHYGEFHRPREIK